MILLLPLALMGMTAEAAAADEGFTPEPARILLHHAATACLEPDLRSVDPADYFQETGWARTSEGWRSDEHSADLIVSVVWPAADGGAASCSFTSSIEASEIYGLVKAAFGEPNDIECDSARQVAGRRLETQGHSASLYVSRDKLEDGTLGGVIVHVLQ